MSIHTNERLDRVIDELSLRYELESEFVEKIRPAASVILGDGFDPQRQKDLLEVLAEVCYRDQSIRRASRKATEALRAFFEQLMAAARRLGDSAA